MQNKQTIKNSLKTILLTTFLYSNSIPPTLEYILTFIEFFIFITFIASKAVLKPLIYNDSIHIGIIVVLIIAILIRSITKASFMKGFYLIFVIWNIQLSTSISPIIIWILLFINILIDIVSKIQFSFQTQNPYSQTITLFVILHYFFMISLSILRFIKFDINYIFPLVQFGSILILIFLKTRSISKNQTFNKQNYLRFYFLVAFYSIAEIYCIFVKNQLFYKHLFSIFGSQIVYQLFQLKFVRQISVQQYLSKKMELEAGYIIFSNLYSKNKIKKDVMKGINNLIVQDSNSLIEQIPFKSLMKENNPAIYYKQVGRRLFNILSLKDDIKSKLFIAQLCLYELKQYVKAKIIIQQLQNKMQMFSLFNKILVKKLQIRFLQQMTIQHERCISPNFYQFIENDKFRNLLLKSTVNFICLWEYTKVKQGIYKKINQLSLKVINSHQQIHKNYKQMNIVCIKMNLLYANYLYHVQRNVTLANKIMEELYFYQEKQLCFDSNNKIYVSLIIQKDQPVKVGKIGGNVNKLLGYERRSLIGMNISALVPQFYKDYHDLLVKQSLENQNDRLFLLKKNTILKNARGSYSIIFICVRLSYNIDNQLFIQGYIKINMDFKHNWSNYLFINHSNKEIVQCSQGITQKINQGRNKKFNATSLFGALQKDFMKKIQHFEMNMTKYFYEPVLKFITQDDQVTMFVKIQPNLLQENKNILNNALSPKIQATGQFQDSQKHNEFKQNQKKARKILIPKMIKYQKYKISDNIKFYLRRQISTIQTLSSIKKVLIICLTLIFIMIVGLFINEGLSIMRLEVQYQNKQSIMKITNNLVRHYMSLSKICLDLSYLTINQREGYQYNEFKMDLRNNILTVQQTNQYFKQYSIKQYQYQSLSSVQQYRTIYQLIAEVISSASIIDTIGYDHIIKQAMIKSFNQVFTQTFVISYSQYINGVQSQLQARSQTRQVQLIAFIVCIFLLGIIIFILTIKSENSLRIAQYQSLRFIGSITFQDQMIDSCKEFLFMITEEKVQNLAKQNSINFRDQQKQLIKDSIKMSQISARQNTGRQLMSNQTGRQTWRQSTNQQFNKQDQSLIQQFPIKLKSSNKIFIFFPFFLLFAVLSLQITNYLVNEKLIQINETQSSKNIIAWMNKPLYFTRLVNAFFTQERGSGISDHDDTFYIALKIFNQQYNSIATFQQIDFAQFRNFKQAIRLIRFQYLCTYAECPERDKDYINILMTTSMQKLANYLKQNFNFVQNINNKISIILDAQNIFRNVIKNLIQVYMNDYKLYTQSYKLKQLLIIGINLGICSLILITYIILSYINVYKDLRKHFKICELIKIDSYLIDKTKLISFKQEQKIKKQNQNKKKNKKKSDNQHDKRSIVSFQHQNQNQQKGLQIQSKMTNQKFIKQNKKHSIFKQIEKNKK